MPEPPDRVTPVIQEHAAEGGDPGEEFDVTNILNDAADPQEDAIEAAGLYLQDATKRDELVLIWRELIQMRFKDEENPSPGVPLTEMMNRRIVTDSVSGNVVTDSVTGDVVWD